MKAAERILSALPERLSIAARKELVRLDVDVLTGARMTQVVKGELHLVDATVHSADMMVWAAGIKAPEFLRTLDGLEVNHGNQLVVTQALQSTRDGNIFAFGDCASCPQPGRNNPVLPRAQAAHQQVSVLAKTLARRLRGDPPVPFFYRDYGSLISFSRYDTVGNLMGRLSGGSLIIEGHLARIFYISLYRMHQVALHGVTRTFLIWLIDKINVHCTRA